VPFISNWNARQVLPGSEVRGGRVTAAETRGAHGQQREADGRHHDGGDDRRHETAPVPGGQAQHQLKQTADDHRADYGSVTLVGADRGRGGHIGERDARHHRQTRADQPRAIQLQAGAETRHQQTRLNHGRRLRGRHLRRVGDDEYRG